MVCFRLGDARRPYDLGLIAPPVVLATRHRGRRSIGHAGATKGMVGCSPLSPDLACVFDSLLDGLPLHSIITLDGVPWVVRAQFLPVILPAVVRGDRTGARASLEMEPADCRPRGLVGA